MTITNFTKNWFRRADDDLNAAEAILKNLKLSSNLACFHSQQVAEKYLKGFIAHNDFHVRKIHDLLSLLEECVKIDFSFGILQDDMLFLSQFYIETRYADDYFEFSRDEAQKAFDAALHIKEFVLQKVSREEK